MKLGVRFVLLLALLGAGAAAMGALSLSSDAQHLTQRMLDAHSERSPRIELLERTVRFADGSEATLRLAEGFDIAVAAEELGKARFMTMSPDGRLFVADMVDYNLSNEGRLLILDDFNEETRQFESEISYLTGLRGPHNVAFYTDEAGNDWLYLTLTEHLLRYPYRVGDTEPSGEAEIIYSFPNTQSEGAEGVVWHITRTALFAGDTLYVSVGSGCNVCEEAPGEDRAVILAMNPDGTEARTYAEGIKNAVGLLWVDGGLWATENGPDHLGADAPDDTLFRIEEGAHYGWPYCYELDGEKHADTSLEWQREPLDCSRVPPSFAAFEPHAAPLGFAHFGSDAHPHLKDSFLVALQGSWVVEYGAGYQLMRVSLEDGATDVFLDGFLSEERERIGRPVHILPLERDSFLMTDDYNGRLYYIFAS
ncbi:glucose/sorbosone dehydrogenase [Candidatus Kaiserbacteria bacterium CG10_big_fil_rev_8_21_14_0_10_59_10]|uniref:Glucose/sorbosone dehydrogenase n=1 Tax=Candidatus Kaiserbacteria bacterium CG10_big_fil_rev_8_21_14_0_10_59_10 TaxID=1974612 RepID=A0A2H0U7I6_9BACT|nr:MAG: glucose/sorbosone dehydrogenase [Candidatus Kaiserbacteria bacterium CG10_big_fil_rev_8_21_14_0_10_59_10]